MTAAQTAASSSLAWLPFALMTVAAWGLYGVALHTGQVAMGDPVNGRYKAFLWVGIAYVLVAVLAPAAVLVINKATWSMTTRGIAWSLFAGVVGAVGAFCVLLAFGAKGNPAVVMSIIFAGAPIVNAVVAMSMHPPAGGWSSIHPLFVTGIVLAACGGLLVTKFKPGPGPAKPPAAVETSGGR